MTPFERALAAVDAALVLGSLGLLLQRILVPRLPRWTEGIAWRRFANERLGKLFSIRALHVAQETARRAGAGD